MSLTHSHSLTWWVGWGSVVVILLAGCMPPMSAAGLRAQAAELDRQGTATVVQSVMDAQRTQQQREAEATGQAWATQAAATQSIWNAQQTTAWGTAYAVQATVSAERIHATARAYTAGMTATAQPTSIAATATRQAVIARRQAQRETAGLWLAIGLGFCCDVAALCLLVRLVRREWAKTILIKRTYVAMLEPPRVPYDVSKEAGSGD